MFQMKLQLIFFTLALVANAKLSLAETDIDNQRILAPAPAAVRRAGYAPIKPLSMAPVRAPLPLRYTYAPAPGPALVRQAGYAPIQPPSLVSARAPLPLRYAYAPINVPAPA